jgi:cardiolipin synthase A/B
MDLNLRERLYELAKNSPSSWMATVTVALRNAPASATVDFVKKLMPPSSNADISFLLNEVINAAPEVISWEALSFSLEMAHYAFTEDAKTRQIEMLWSGPPPAGHLPARRIDQALYDLIAASNTEIMLVTFAAVKVDRLSAELLAAVRRGVRVRLILEFAEASEGQLSFDALRAFPAALIDTAEVYYWPVENRERNQAGRPGKLHAKLAAIDNVVLVSSANLTDDAFSRNLELGAKLTDPEVVLWAKEHFQGLIRDNILRRLLR